MFKIGEFSRITQVTIRMLRYYDEIGILKPAQIDPWTGYRMYSVDQISLLNKIVYLRDSGFHISEIAAALDRKDDSLLIKLLNQKYLETEKAIQVERDKIKKIEIAKKEILSGKDKMCYNISIKSIPSYQVLTLRKTMKDYYAEKMLWEELSLFAKQQQTEISSHTFSIYHDIEYKETSVDIELCAPVKKIGKDAQNFVYRNTEPIPIMACTMAYGNFQNIRGTYLAFAEWLQKNIQYRMAGLTRQIVHRGPWNEENPDRYLVELQIPLEQI